MFSMLAAIIFSASVLGVPVGPDGVDIQGDYLRLVMTPSEAGVINELHLLATNHDVAGAGGLLQEGFGVGSFYVPNRRLNEKLEVLDNVDGRPMLQLTYDCDGPNIKGLHVTRTMEPLIHEAAIQVTWKVENQGAEDQWAAPWVRNELAPGGGYDPNDRIDIPSRGGLLHTDQSAYFSAARNWAAVTDPTAKESVCGVFNAEQIYAFLAIHGAQGPERGISDAPVCGFQAAFVPVLLKKGATWETTYRISVVRGLSHVDFATDKFAAQADYADGKLAILLAGVSPASGLTLDARVRASNDRVWTLDGKAFDLDPNTLVRCTYDWTPSGDGTYELLALLKQGGQAIELGKGFAPPHGGMDTQLTIGAPRAVAFEPWTDAPFKLERGPRVLERTLAASNNGTAFWFESSLEKIFPEDNVQSAGALEPTVQVRLARNERESFQLVIRPGESQALRGATVSASALTQAGGASSIPASDIQVSRVAYYPVEIPSDFETPTGLYPDALPPLASFDAPAGTATPIWFTIFARPGIAAGIYRGSILVRSEGMPDTELGVEVEVYDFDLPARPALRTDFGYSSSLALDTCTAHGCALGQDELDRLYRRNAFEHRITLRQAAQLPAESADYAASLEAFRRQLKPLLDEGATTIAVPPSLLDAPEQLKQANDFVAAQQLESIAFCPIADMPPRPAWPRLFEGMQQWAATAPNIPIMATTYGLSPFLPESMGVWAIHLPVMDTINNKPVLERIQSGGEVWWFVNHEPARPYGNFFIDLAGIEHRILFWQTWALGVKGFHYNNINASAPGVDPYRSQLDVTPVNGNGFLVYPGKNGPVNSIRWEIIRDGIEDVDYLVAFQEIMRKLAKTKPDAPELTRAIGTAAGIKALVPDLVSYPRDPKLLESKRDEIARLIVEMRKAAG